MGQFGSQLQAQGATVLGQAAGGALSALVGQAFATANDRRQRAQQAQLDQIQNKYTMQLQDYEYGKQLDMWKATNYPAQVQQIEQAGLNPALLYGLGGGGGTTTGSISNQVSGSEAPRGGNEQMQMAMFGAQQMKENQLLQSQLKVNESIANKNNADAQAKQGWERGNVEADTANKILNSVILDYTGQEAKEEFTRVRHPNRGIEEKTYEDELSARQGIAGTIYELWGEGLLHDKSAYEIEQLLLQNNKLKSETDEVKKKIDMLEQNIKGAKLDNIMKDLETKLQTETGIDRNSPYWLKIIGRLFVKLFN